LPTLSQLFGFRCIVRVYVKGKKNPILTNQQRYMPQIYAFFVIARKNEPLQKKTALLPFRKSKVFNNNGVGTFWYLYWLKNS
jgi:hypothetical protein